MALHQLAKAQRFSGTELLGFPGGLPPWGRPLPSHPPLPSMVPGGGLSQDRTAWRPSRAHCLVPVPALSPLSRALCKDTRLQAGLLEPIDPQGWTIPWNGHTQAKHHSHAAFPSLAP
jgi:hypothetical protein